MAPPIINSVVAMPKEIRPGRVSVVTVVASDPDARATSLAVTVTDSQGNSVTGVAVLTVQDPLTYELVDTDGVGFSIVQRPGQPGVFDVTAPSN